MLSQLIQSSLKITAQDRVCILVDETRKSTASIIKSSIVKNADIKTVPSEITCNNLPSDIKDVLLGTQYNVIIICIHMEQAIWHSPERKTAKYDLGKRLTSIIAPCEVLTASVSCSNIPDVSAIGKYYKSFLSPQKQIHITTSNGTNIKALIGENVFVEDGNYSSLPAGGDIPYGETGFSPQPGSVEGTLVYDLKVQHLGIVQAGDIVLSISKDEIIELSGEKQPQFAELLKKHKIFRFISEISFGLNPCIKVHANTNIIEEKKAGTVHFGQGGNSAYGQRVGPHFDGVVDAPTVFIDDRCYLKQGKFIDNGMTSELKKLLYKHDLIYD